MKQLNSLLTSVLTLFFLLIFLIFPFKTNAQSSKEVIIDSLFLDNEQVIFDNRECKLDLKLINSLLANFH